MNSNIGAALLILGEAGVGKALSLISEQLDTGMALTGTTDLAAVSPDVIVKPDALR